MSIISAVEKYCVTWSSLERHMPYSRWQHISIYKFVDTRPLRMHIYSALAEKSHPDNRDNNGDHQECSSAHSNGDSDCPRGVVREIGACNSVKTHKSQKNKFKSCTVRVTVLLKNPNTFQEKKIPGITYHAPFENSSFNEINLTLLPFSLCAAHWGFFRFSYKWSHSNAWRYDECLRKQGQSIGRARHA